MSQKPAATPPAPQTPVQSIQPQVKHTPAPRPGVQTTPPKPQAPVTPLPGSPQTLQQYKTMPAPASDAESLRPVRVNTPKRQDTPSTPGSTNMPTPIPPLPTTPNPAQAQSPGGTSGNGNTPQAKELSLTKRYLADQYNQKQHQPQSLIQSPLTPLPATPEPPTVVKPPAPPTPSVSTNGQAWNNGGQKRPATPPAAPTTPSSFAPFSQQQPSVVPSPFGPAGQLAPAPPLGQPAPAPQMSAFQSLRNGGASAMSWDIPADVPEIDPLDAIFNPPSTNVESMTATSKAAERWRKSWRDRQRAEAAPAVGVSRGQARVAEPLLVMQHSIIRMRAIIMPKQQAQKQKEGSVRFGKMLLVLLVLLGGFLAYIAYSYLPTNAAQTIRGGTPAKVGVAPVLTVPAGKSTAVVQGQILKIHGDYFGPQDPITFLLDTTPITATASGQVRSNAQGAFNASFTIDTTWQPASYAFQAQDSNTGQRAQLSVQILPAVNTPNTTSLQLSSQDAQPLQSLSFTGIAGVTNPAGQRITLTNSSTTDPLTWTVTALTTTDTNWLIIDDGKMSGGLDIAGSDSIGISVQTSGLVGSTKAYQGYIIFNVDKQGLVIVPITLQLQRQTVEVTINPNPIIAVLKSATQGQCQDLSLTLINMSDQIVFWAANPFTNDRQYIHLNGQPTAQGTMNPSGQAGDTVVIALTCNNVHVGEKLYNITVSYNGISQTVPVSIRTS